MIAFNQEVETADVQDILAAEFGVTPTVITYGSKSTVRITTKYLIEDDLGSPVIQNPTDPYES